MSLLNTLVSDNSIAQEKDSIGGNDPLESGLYPATIAMAYAAKSTGGALGLFLTMKTADKKEIRQTLWMTSGTAKGGKNYYEKDGEKHYLPGYLQANSIALLAAGKEISVIETETKVINVWSPDAKAEVPTKVEALMDLIGKEIIVGLIKQTVDKNKKNDVTGVYEATGETREENEIDKIFRASDRMTTAEIRAQATEAVFIETWAAKHTGVTKNKSKGGSGTTGAPGAKSGAASTKPTTSLFG